MSRLSAVMVLVVAATGTSAFQACVPGRYGERCEHVCACSDFEDCDEGPSGSGDCTCILGFEEKCGVTSPFADAEQSTLFDMRWTKRSTAHLFLDKITSRAVRQVHNATISWIVPQPLRGSLELVLFNPQVAERIGLSADVANASKQDFLELFSGRRLMRGSRPFCHAYGGHQFGSWSGQLGDGRALSLGEVLGVDGITYEVALKGSGKTPYSRAGDGRAVLANALREMIGDVALVALGVPAVQALAVIGGDERTGTIMRDEWYTGELRAVRAGVIVRVGASMLRFGSVQLAAKRSGVEGVVRIARVALSAIAELESRDDPAFALFARSRADPTLCAECLFARRRASSCAHESEQLSETAVMECLLRTLVRRVAALVAAWQSVGFAHGVLNTDNMSLLGMTIDLNVYGWLSDFDEHWTPNHIDDDRPARYVLVERSPSCALRADRQAAAPATAGTRSAHSRASPCGTSSGSPTLSPAWRTSATTSAMRATGCAAVRTAARRG
jgi:uncharacterized protein YdiU (UPF0061 family)